MSKATGGRTRRKAKQTLRVDLSVCSEQDGNTRFPRSFEYDFNGPMVKCYRNNLTALSQHYNYLFICYSSEIRVYQPEFPSQRVPEVAVLTFELPFSGQGVTGYQDPNDAHAANHIIVGDIGNQETLLAACDDGDIIAISTRLIHHAAQRNIAVANGVDDLPAEDIRAFFTGNVGASAWGLAIHTEARLFAVSANTQDVTVFAFALGGGSPEGSSLDSGEDDLDDDLDDLIENADWNALNGPPTSSQRASQNLQILLRGHTTNIPSIAFCNTAADLEGKYLVSTDIDDRTCVWDIWQQKLVRELSLSANPWGSVFQERSRRRGWGVACLDPFSFRLADSRSQKLSGLNCRPRKVMNGNEVNITDIVDQVPDSSRRHPAMSEMGSVPGMMGIDTQGHEDLYVSDDGPESQDDEDYLEIRSEERRRSEVSMQASPASSSFNHDFANHSPWATTMDWTDEIPSGFEPSSPLIGTRNTNPRPTANGVTPPWTVPESHGSDLPFQLLQTSEHDICMYENEGDTRVVCEYVLFQVIPPRLHGLTIFERLNMIHQIPEMGVVVIGNMTGRAAVLTFTRSKLTTSTRSAFRIDWILPLKSQEDQGVRPEEPLMGLVVSPVQGQENVSDFFDEGASDLGAGHQTLRSESRKFRIMLIYYNHTILSYEIARASGGPEYEVEDRLILL